MESNTVNVKNLPQTEEVLNGDYIIVEKQSGSHIIDFRDFVVGPTNTSFYNALVTNIKTISTYNIGLCATMENNFIQTAKFTDTRFQQLTSSWATYFPSFFTQTGTIIINNLERSAVVTFESNLDSINIENITIQQQSIDMTDNSPLKPLFMNVGITDTGSDANNNVIYTYNLSVSTLSAVNKATTYRYMILTPYFQVIE